MKQLFLSIILTCLLFPSMAQSINDRVVANDPENYRSISSVHGGAGQMGFMQLIGRSDLATNFLYLHTGVINGKSGIGHHFHHTIEEMYVILDGEAEFTINGRTAIIKAPAVIPCKLGDSHAIYNASDEPLRWLNFAVSETKAVGDAFDLNDSRVGAVIEPIPSFVSGRLDKDQLKKNQDYFAGEEVLYRRVLVPTVFRTDWNHVDHVILPANSTSEKHSLNGIEEVYYVIKGEGTATINGETISFKTADSFYGALGENLVLANTGNDELELIIIGIAAPGQKQLAIAKPLIQPKSMVLQMDFVVEEGKANAFEKMYYSIYVPAMTVQDGYLSSKLLRLFSEELANGIEAEPTAYNYQIQIEFDTEENRRKWVASEQHKIAWPAATDLAKEFKWRGYDVMGDDEQ